MKDGIWLPIVAAGIFLVASTVIYNLVGASSAKPIIQGGLVGLLLAALNWPSNPGGGGLVRLLDAGGGGRRPGALGRHAADRPLEGPDVCWLRWHQPGSAGT